MWELPKSIVYVDGYSSHARSRNSAYRHSSGILGFVLNEHSEDTDLIGRWDGVLIYIDRNFYNELGKLRIRLWIYLTTKKGCLVI